jgi:hypothetical protein
MPDFKRRSKCSKQTGHFLTGTRMRGLWPYLMPQCPSRQVSFNFFSQLNAGPDFGSGSPIAAFTICLFLSFTSAFVATISILQPGPGIFHTLCGTIDRPPPAFSLQRSSYGTIHVMLSLFSLHCTQGKGPLQEETHSMSAWFDRSPGPSPNIDHTARITVAQLSSVDEVVDLS